jgi:transcription elongation factor GreA-like protein
VQDLDRLPSNFTGANQKEFFDFFDKFGTHMIVAATMGSRQGKHFEFSNSFLQTLESTDVNVAASVAASARKAVFSFDLNADVEVDQFEEQISQIQNTDTKEFSITLGPSPTDGTWNRNVRAVAARLLARLHTLPSAD